MSKNVFEDWTQTSGRAPRRRNFRRRAHLRQRILAFTGILLIAVAIVYLLVDSRIIGYAMTPEQMSVQTPKDQMLNLTVPRMKRVKQIPVYTASADDLKRLDQGAIHVKGTGFPWQNDSNVYIAGHRLGYAGTGSFLLFYDLNKVRDGDKVILEDANGGKYIYRVFDKVVVEPTDISVTKPVPNKSIVSLQACTLPDYSKRLVVRAELERTEAAPAKQASSPDGAGSS